MTSADGAVAAGHPETARAGALMLEAGGNAFDAALAAFCAACVCEPALASLGGGGFLLARPAADKLVVYDFFPQTPSRRRDPESFDFFPIDANFGPALQEFHIGRASIAVPGAVAGLFDIHRDLCRLPMAEIMAPAVALARAGVSVEPFQAYLLEVLDPIFGYRAESRAIYASRTNPEGLLAPHEIQVNPDLADLFDALARDGADLFYRGEVAARIAALCEDGGLISAADLERYRVEKRSPLMLSFGDAKVATNPPPSAGGLLIFFSLSLWERRYAGLNPIEAACEMVRVMAATNKARIDSGLADDPEGDAVLGLLEPELVTRYENEIGDRPFNPRGTTQISVIDGAGNAASMTLSNGEGCGHVVPGTGSMLNNMLGEEDINPLGFHRWHPDTRISSMMAPSLLRHGDGRLVALGSGGSNRIRTAIFQVLRHLLDDEMELDQVITAPRLHYEAGHLSIEPGFGAGEIEALCGAFPEHKVWDSPNMFFGGVHAVEWDPREHIFAAVGDPRRAGAVAFPGK